MDCAEIIPKLAAWHDGELSSAEAERIARHLETCRQCRAQIADLRVLSSLIANAEAAQRAPAQLHKEIRRRTQRSWRPAAIWSGLGGALAGAALSLAVMFGMNGPHLDQDLIDAQLRDQGLNETRLAVDVPAKDFSAEGYPLAGTHNDVIGGKRGAVLVYRANDHIISVFVTSAASAHNTAPDFSQRSGFEVARWVDDGLNYAAVSDADPKTFETFVKLACKQL